MFPDADAANNSSSSGQLESASSAVGSGSPGAHTPGGESCGSSSVPATAAEGDDEEDDEEETPAAPERGVSRSMLAASGLGLLLAVSLFHLGQPHTDEGGASGGRQCLALLLLRLLFCLGCAASSFFLGTLLALLGPRRGRLWPPPDFPAAWSRRYPGKSKAAPLLQAAAI